MKTAGDHPAFLRELTWGHLGLVAAVMVGCALLVLIGRAIVRRVAEGAPSHHRLLILRAAPVGRLLVIVAGVAIIVPILVEPNFEDVVALLATVGLALAFAVKDYVSCLIAGVVTILENTYQPGDWIEFDGAYGEVKTIGARAVHIVTVDDTEVTIPHARIWSSKVVNATRGAHSILCAADFYLDADHDGAAVREALLETANASPYRKAASDVKVVAAETPFGTRYKLKAVAADSRDQFAMTTALTLDAKARLRSLGVAFARTPYARAGD